MMCYRDTTFCTAACGNEQCSLKFTHAVSEAAQKWWGRENAPVAVGDRSVGGAWNTNPRRPDGMSDMAEIFNALKERGKEKRASNRDSSPGILATHNITFTSKNHGAHLIVEHNGKTADFWPGTGKYQIRGTGKYRRGVFNLIRELKEAVGEPEADSDQR